MLKCTRCGNKTELMYPVNDRLLFCWECAATETVWNLFAAGFIEEIVTTIELPDADVVISEDAVDVPEESC